MEEITRHISEQVASLGLRTDCTGAVEAMARQGILSPEMGPSAAYTAFLTHQSQFHPIFDAILKRRYLFDISFSVDDKDGKSDSKNSKKEATRLLHMQSELELRIEKSMKGRIEYIFSEERDSRRFIGIKLNDSAYEKIEERYNKSKTDICGIPVNDIPTYLIPHCLVLDNFSDISKVHFYERIFNYREAPTATKIFAEFMEHLKSIEIPVSISSYDLFNGESNILPVYEVVLYMCASARWPKESEAKEAVKAAIYCQYYSKSEYGAAVDRRYVVFRYKDMLFRIRILTEEDCGARHKIAVAMQGLLRENSLSRKCRMGRFLLGGFGFYPMAIDELLVDCVVLLLGRGIVGDGRFIETFAGFDWNLAGRHLSLDNFKLSTDYGSSAHTLRITLGSTVLHCPLPRPAMLSEIKTALSAFKDSPPLQFFNKDDMTVGKLKIPLKIPTKTPLLLSTAPYLFPDLSSFDFVLSKYDGDGFHEIAGSYDSGFILGMPGHDCFIGRRLRREASIHYSPTHELLMVRVNEGFDVDCIANVLIIETSFGYIRFSRGKCESDSTL